MAEARRLDALVCDMADRNAELVAEVVRLRAGRGAAPGGQGPGGAVREARKDNLRRPGRKAGDAYGRHGRRQRPFP